nr:MAG TPA: hypothetical protein [Caudoviricetes sp.]
MAGGGGHRTKPASGEVAAIICPAPQKNQGKTVELLNFNKI